MPRTTTTPTVAEQDVHEISAYPRARLGEKIVTADGRIYRYAKAGATALDAGKLVVAATQAANHENNTVAVAASVGATKITVTLGATAVTANQYAEGFMVVNDEAGEGNTYKILSHPAADGAATCVFTLEDPIKVAFTTSSQVSLVLNPFSGLVISVTDQADLAIGVPNVAVTAAYYFWVQTGGVAAVWADESVTAGLAVTTGTGTAGQVEALDGAGEQQIGVALQALVDTEYRAVFLTVDR